MFEHISMTIISINSKLKFEGNTKLNSWSTRSIAVFCLLNHIKPMAKTFLCKRKLFCWHTRCLGPSCVDSLKGNKRSSLLFSGPFFHIVVFAVIFFDNPIEWSKYSPLIFGICTPEDDGVFTPKLEVWDMLRHQNLELYDELFTILSK